MYIYIYGPSYVLHRLVVFFTLSRFKDVLDAENVHNLTEDGGPKLALTKHLDASKPHNNQIRIISCGGDGTTGWILSVMDAMNLPAGTVIAH